MIDFASKGYPRTLRTATATAHGTVVIDHNGNEVWPGIVSRFQLVLLAGRRSKQLLKGALPRIPADPLKRRNTSIALEELRQGLIRFKSQNGNEHQMLTASIDTVVNKTLVEHGPHFDLPKVE